MRSSHVVAVTALLGVATPAQAIDKQDFDLIQRGRYLADAGDCGGSHMTHADATCASASVAGTPAVVPVLQPDVAACAEVPDGRTSGAGSGPDGGRAPPSLAELQLLRI